MATKALHDGLTILDLPDELLVNIIGNTDVGSTITLRATRRRLRYMTPSIHDQQEQDIFPWLAGLECSLNHKKVFACYRCRNLQHYRNFLASMLRGHMATWRAAPPEAKMFKRICFSCQETSLSSGSAFDIDHGLMVKCRSCRQVTTEFDKHCFWCYECTGDADIPNPWGSRWNGRLTNRYMNTWCKWDSEEGRKRQKFLAARQEHLRYRDDSEEVGWQRWIRGY